MSTLHLITPCNVHLQGCSFGYHAGGWGKPPVDENGKPLYGDVFGVQGAEVIVSSFIFYFHGINKKKI